MPAASAAENIALNQFPTSRRLIRWGEVRRTAVASLEEWGCGEVADTPVEQARPAGAQDRRDLPGAVVGPEGAAARRADGGSRPSRRPEGCSPASPGPASAASR
ncbi:hypothetical protein GCM10025868_36100 [Angustibacter aerolatus]|uniref:Uncharacterized protein n=1 Tax=Angustibacter aerolatus TaxID=1162965 RepID=A0ABQ6JNN2_9ACTN|nr:hypothetical protein [Angustibacter aerolatus]GMA88360.1 hypothetical protein GCM10025868_36100 [Angustibacter aerolatus]